MTIIWICILSVIGISFINSIINTQRQIALNNIDRLYDQIELFVVANNLRIDGDLRRFLKGLKTYKVYPEFADIHVLLVTVQNMKAGEFEEGKKRYDEFIVKLPLELAKLKTSFDQQISLSIFLSIFRFEFLGFLVYCLVKSLCKAIYHKSTSKLIMIWTVIRDIFRYDLVIIAKYSEKNYRFTAA